MMLVHIVLRTSLVVLFFLEIRAATTNQISSNPEKTGPPTKDIYFSSLTNEIAPNPDAPCYGKEGYAVEERDRRIYYLCTWNPLTSIFNIQTLFCNGGTVYNPLLKQCAQPGNSTTEYSCLKQHLDTDASRICFNETIDLLKEELEIFLDASAFRGDSKRNFHLSVRDIHYNMRTNYATLIQETGRNIYPLIVATDSEPDLAGIGGVYKVYFRNGTMKRIVPVSPTFELHKCLSHMVLGIFAIVAPYFRSPNSLNWQPALKNFNQRVAEATFLLSSSGLPQKEKEHVKKMLKMVEDYTTDAFKTNQVSHQKFHKFATEMAPLIDKSMQLAAKAHVTGTIPALQKLKEEMGLKEWKKTYVIIPTVWPVSLYNIRLQAFRKVMDFKQIKQQVLITEGARNEDDARTTLGRIVADRALAQLVFGGSQEDSMRDHLFSLSTRRDLLSTVEEEAIDKWCDGKDDWAVLTKSGTKSRCPMTKTVATMLRQAA